MASHSNNFETRGKKNAKYKNLVWFFVAASSVVASGCLIVKHFDYVEISILLWCTIGGTFLIYRINDYIDSEQTFRFNIRQFLSEKRHLIIVLHLFLFAFPVAFFTISKFSFVVLSVIAALGVFYSISFSVGTFRFRLKNVLLLKNISIGLAWGGLVFVGAGESMVPDVVVLFLFTSVQVAIGSMIRDIPDKQKDEEAGAKTVPVVFGLRATLLALYIFNLLSLALLAHPEITDGIAGVILITVFWRMINLMKLNIHSADRLWGQVLNLFTCVIIFLGVLLKYAIDEFTRG